MEHFRTIDELCSLSGLVLRTDGRAKGEELFKHRNLVAAGLALRPWAVADNQSLTWDMELGVGIRTKLLGQRLPMLQAG